MRIDRYELFGPFATGGMATVHFGKLFASAGFQRVVAIKVPHAQFMSDHGFRTMFLDEARIVARIRSPHVVATLDILEEGERLYQVMEYANGPALSAVLKAVRAREETVPIPLVLAIVADALEGLHAAHEVVDDHGAPLHVVHRDVSPQNILVTEDGVAKVIDFGIATAAGRMHLTEPGNVKGKVSYMAPEQLDGRVLDRRADIYAMGVVLYETLTGERPFAGRDFATTALMQLTSDAPDPRALRPDIPDELAAIVLHALDKRPQDRFSTARSMADALQALSVPRAPPREVAEWLAETNRDFFIERNALVADLPSVDTSDISVAVPGKNEEPTVLEVVRAESGTLAGGGARASTTSPRTGWRIGLAALVVAGGAAATFAVMVQARRPAGHVDTVGSTAVPAASVSATATVTAATGDVPSAEPALSTPLLPAPVHPRRGGRPDVASQKPTPSSPSSMPAVSEPPCCAGDLRIRLTNCVDNCPPGK